MRILLAEDDHHVAVILQICLEKIGGHVVSVCGDGEAAIQCLHNNSYDLVILDGMMPKKSGVQTAQEMKLMKRSEPIIFLSAKSEEKDIAEFLSLSSGYIAKPFDPQLVCRQIDEIITHHLAQRTA